MGFKSYIFLKKGLVQVRSGHGLTYRVNQIFSGCYPDQTFIKPRLVQLPGRPARPDRVL
jgi:hypothetical protein